MRRLFINSLAGCALFGLSCVTSAQIIRRQADNPFYSEDEYQSTHSMFDKVWSDLNGAERDSQLSHPGDGTRFDVARTELQRLETSWDRAYYDSGQMANMVAAIQTILNDNRLMGHDREALNADLSRLLEFRQEYY